jgi:hypothetical protein
VKSSRFLIEHQCPQCGAPATLEETDHLFACEFCRVKSYLLSKDFFRYTLPHSAPEGKDLVFFPYWRFKGMLFSCVCDGIKHRIVDVSQQALSSQVFPFSVGLRSQVLKLRFVSPETEGYFLQPKLPFEEVLENIEGRFSASLPEPVYHRAFVGQTLSQINSPFYLDAKLYDAVLNKPVPSSLPEDFDISAFAGGPPDWRIQFIPALCPNCGWDLVGERDSLVLTCKNCDSAWYPGKTKFKKLKFVHIPDGSDEVTYLPFYRIRADISGITLQSYSDLVKVANLPGVVQREWEKRAFYFWTPAFKVRPKDFLRFAGNVTLSQPQEEFVPELPKSELYPVTLPITEAVKSQKLNLAGFMKPKKTLFPRLPEIDIKPKNFLLVYMPFHQRGNELSHPTFRLRINKNLLAFARHL